MMDELRWALIGCGDISRKAVAPALQTAAGSRLDLVSRKDAGLLGEFAAQFKVPRTASDWRDAVKDPEIDAVYIATPVALHAEQAIAALEAGKDVLCEKPLGLDPRECERIIAARKASGRRLGVAYYRRFYPALGRIKEILDSGEIGRPVLAQADAFEYFNRGPGEPRAWLLDPARSGGGPLMDFGCHRIEFLLNLFGRPERVDGFVDRLRFERRVEDTALTVLTFPGALQALLRVSHAVEESRDSLDIYGTDGSIHVPVLNAGEFVVRTAEGERREVHPRAENPHLPLVEDFIRSIKEDRPPAVTGEEAAEVNRVIAAVYAD